MEQVKLKDITIKVGSGATPFGGKNSYKTTGIALIRSLNVFDLKFSYEELAYINEEQAKKLNNVTIEPNDILLNITGASVARCCIVPPNLLPARVNQHVSIVRINNELANPYFIQYLLVSPYYKQKLLSIAQGGATREALTKESIENFEIIIPKSKKMQDKIAKILSNYDDLIENNNRRIKILEEIAQKIYKEWFVDFKFPGHETTTIKESVLSSIITPIKGKNITKSKAKIGNVPVVGGGIEPAYYHNVANTQAPVITISASGANAGFVNLYYKDIWASDCSYIDATMTNYIYYIYLLLKNNQIEITNMQLGAAQPHVYPRDLVNLKIKEFPIEVVANFEKMISPIFENIKVLSNKNENLKQTRDILLPRLISGEINVENMEVL